MAVVRKLLVLGTMVALAAATLNAQAVPKIVLKPAVAKLDEEFTSIISLRELADGRVLVSDGKEDRVVVADFKTGSVVQIGRNGQGPGEYATAGMLRPLAGDSTLMVEAGAGRWHFFAGAKIAFTLPPDAPIIIAVGRNPIGADARGNVVRLVGIAAGGGGRGGASLGALPESSFVIRGNRATIALDTIARVRARKMTLNTMTNAKGEVTSVSLVTPPLSVGEEAAVFPDGWLAIVRFDPYRVDWVNPEGKLATGSALPWPAVKLTERERTAYFAARSRDAARNPNGPIPDAIRKQIDEASKFFPDTYPPTVAGGLIAMEDGRLLVRHPESADFPNARYDIVDRRGRLAGTIALGKGESLLAVTRTAAYVSWKDDDDIQRIRKHPWP